MPEISQFVVTEAYAEYNSHTGALSLDFRYPKNPSETNTRLGPNPEFGVQTLTELIKHGHAQIANPKNPISPPTAGSLPITSDGKIIHTRRDNGAPVHKMFHAAYSGFARTPDELYSEKGMRTLGQRESAEEVVLITRDKNPYLIVTSSTKQETIKSAKRLGLENLPLREVKEELLPGKDTLNVSYGPNEGIYQLPCFFTMLWNIDASTIAMQIRQLDIHSEEILPIDAEGIFTESGDEYKVHFNRESFITNPSELYCNAHIQTLNDIGYGCPMLNPQVFQSHWDSSNKMRIVETPHNSPLEYLGPGATPVNKPNLWAPQDTLRACLDGLGVPGYAGKKLQWELEISKAFAEDFISGKGDEKGTVNEACVIPE